MSTSPRKISLFQIVPVPEINLIGHGHAHGHDLKEEGTHLEDEPVFYEIRD